jgi:hypothetical protein
MRRRGDNLAQIINSTGSGELAQLAHTVARRVADCIGAEQDAELDGRLRSGCASGPWQAPVLSSNGERRHEGCRVGGGE